MKEKTISNAIIRAIHARYPTAQMRKRLSSGSTSTTGWPDITGHIGGIHVEIETKQPGEKPRKLQLSRIKKLAENGAIAFWADSVDGSLELLQEMLKRWRPKNK
jgi:Holliday junction resolvase